MPADFSQEFYKIYDYKGVPLRELKGKAKLQYIWDYYKFGIFAVLIALIILISGVHRYFTKKDTVLGLALVNVIMSEDNISALNQDYLKERELDAKHNEIKVTSNLTVIRDDNTGSFDYASEAKLLAMITAGQLDVVFLDEAALQVFINGEYTDRYISLDGTAFAESIGLEGPVYAAVIGNAKHPDEAETFLAYLEK